MAQEETLDFYEAMGLTVKGADYRGHFGAISKEELLSQIHADKLAGGQGFAVIFLWTGRPTDATLELSYRYDTESTEYMAERSRDVNSHHIAIGVNDIYDVFTRLQDQGCTILLPPRDGGYGFVESPDGASVELLQNGDTLPPQEPWKSMPSGFTRPHLKKTAFDLELLRDGVAVITGSGSGIGEGVARHCALQLGMRVCVVDLRAAAAEAAADWINEAAGGVVACGIAADVTSDEAMAALPAAVADAFPGVPLRLVHANAGVWPKPGVLEASTMADWNFAFEVNTLGVLRTLKTLVPIMIDQDEPGVVITTSSMAGVTHSFDGADAYHASKHATVTITESLHNELQQTEAGRKIAVHVLCPGEVKGNLGTTSIESQSRFEGGPAEDAPIAGERSGGYSEHAAPPELTPARVIKLAARARAMRMSDELRQLIGENDEALAQYAIAHAAAYDANTWSSEDFARERVFSCVARGEFYMIGDNKARFGIKEMVRHRAESILAQAPPSRFWETGSHFDPRAGEVGALQQEAAERAARAVVEAEAAVDS